MPSTKTVSPSTENFLVSSKLRYQTPASPDYDTTRQVYSLSHDRPSVIVRPREAAEVSALVKHCLAESVPFVVRVGGHDLYGRSHVDGELTIDLRDINHVQVDADRMTAQVGGGILFDRLLGELEKHHLHTPTGTISSVGLVGWALGGGYGDSSAWGGLGLDNILGAKVVNAKGDLVEADDEMLKGIRGSGGFGIIVEVTIKVYPSDESQTAMYTFDTSKGLKSTIVTVLTSYSKLHATDPLPSNLACQIMICGNPGMDHLVLVRFHWRGPRNAACESWAAKIATLGPPVGDPAAAIQTTTARATMAELTAMIPSTVWTRPQTVTVSHLSADVIEACAEHCVRMPLTGSGLFLHELRPCSPSSGALAEFPDAVFAARMPHVVFEIVGGSVAEEESEAARQWALDCRNGLLTRDAALPISFLALTPPEHVDIDKMYGENARELRRLRKKFDPQGVFKYAVPKIS